MQESFISNKQSMIRKLFFLLLLTIYSSFNMYSQWSKDAPSSFCSYVTSAYDDEARMSYYIFYMDFAPSGKQTKRIYVLSLCDNLQLVKTPFSYYNANHCIILGQTRKEAKESLEYMFDNFTWKAELYYNDPWNGRWKVEINNDYIHVWAPYQEYASSTRHQVSYRTLKKLQKRL